MVRKYDIIYSLLIVLAGCDQTVHSKIQTTSSRDSIFATGLYEDPEYLTVAAQNHFYRPTYELWSDGAEKVRWIYLPPDSKIKTTNPNAWNFPVGTKIWKEFRFNGKRVETRLIEKKKAAPFYDSWIYQSYVWNAEQTDATLVAESGLSNVATTPYGTSHDIPSLNDCQTCHNTGTDPVLGFDALQLSGPGEGLRLSDLEQRELLTRNLPSKPGIPTTHQPTVAALGYLHANCGNCHNPYARGGMHTSLYLKHDVTAETLEDLPAIATTVDMLTHYYVVPGRTLAIDSYNVERGHPDTSAIYVRMQDRSSTTMMPPIGTKVVDREGLRVIADWINTL